MGSLADGTVARPCGCTHVDPFECLNLDAPDSEVDGNWHCDCGCHRAQPPSRDQGGRYFYHLDRVCTCGARKGAHLAESPFPMGDGSCDGFKLADDERNK